MGFRFQGWGALVLAALLCGRIAAETNQTGQIQVLVYHDARIPAKTLRYAGLEVVRIFRETGITVDWLDCTGRRDSGECKVGPASNQFVLHIVHGGKTSTDSVYGEAFLGEDGEGKYADIFFDRVNRAHFEFGVNLERLLGAVATHEIGHLLLGLHSHSWTGIMVPVWEKQSLRLMQWGHLFFTSEQTGQIRDRLRKNEVRVADIGVK